MDFVRIEIRNRISNKIYSGIIDAESRDVLDFINKTLYNLDWDFFDCDFKMIRWK